MAGGFWVQCPNDLTKRFEKSSKIKKAPVFLWRETGAKAFSRLGEAGSRGVPLREGERVKRKGLRLPT